MSRRLNLRVVIPECCFILFWLKNKQALKFLFTCLRVFWYFKTFSYNEFQNTKLKPTPTKRSSSDFIQCWAQTLSDPLTFVFKKSSLLSKQKNNNLQDCIACFQVLTWNDVFLRILFDQMATLHIFFLKKIRNHSAFLFFM